MAVPLPSRRGYELTIFTGLHVALPTQREDLLVAMLTEETRSKDPQSRHCARLLFRELLFKIVQARVPENSLIKLTGI